MVIPEKTEAGYLYISLEYRTAIHRCACGCGEEIITPLSPRDWKIQFDGETVSLSPSIGSWQLPCRSHYFICRNRVEWVKEKSKGEKVKKNSIKSFFGKIKNQIRP